ncbi:Phosphatidylcholine transfer protein [Babesia sp. Xinjiang]|uniref:Phosphatidylcholine transfer protein n=1 Tax=Babesia sp. Xinjiang TaxID=462227 RepID=UPI000A236AA7|nr:Phosphatidylcholine transfer protein [Babesia sp. Xinjiang]ORM40691.1 Phosphatidylcholine transfer protein [Babesia sp. Xinjiang]
MASLTTTNQCADGDPCATEPLTPEMCKLLEQFKNGGNFTDWQWVRDYHVKPSTLKLFSRLRGTSTLKEFLVYGEIDACKEKLVELIVEMSQRSKWDDTYVEHQIVKPAVNGTDVLFSVSKYPFPLAKRTYVVKRTIYGSVDDIIVLLSKVIPYNYNSKYKWSTKVDEFESILMVRNTKEGQEACEMLATYYENPRVILPNMYLNSIIENLVPRILEKMIIACKKYGSDKSTDYCRGLYCVPLPDTETAESDNITSKEETNDMPMPTDGA